MATAQKFTVKNAFEAKERLDALLVRYNAFAKDYGVHQRAELLGQIHALQWMLGMENNG